MGLRTQVLNYLNNRIHDRIYVKILQENHNFFYRSHKKCIFRDFPYKSVFFGKNLKNSQDDDIDYNDTVLPRTITPMVYTKYTHTLQAVQHNRLPLQSKH